MFFLLSTPLFTLLQALIISLSPRNEAYYPPRPLVTSSPCQLKKSSLRDFTLFSQKQMLNPLSSDASNRLPHTKIQFFEKKISNLFIGIFCNFVSCSYLCVRYSSASLHFSCAKCFDYNN